MSLNSIPNSTTSGEGVADATMAMDKSGREPVKVEGEHDSNSTGGSQSESESVHELIFHLEDLGDVVVEMEDEEEADGNTIPTSFTHVWPTSDHPNLNPATFVPEHVDWVVPFDLHCMRCSFRMVEAGKAMACVVEEIEYSDEDEDARLLGRPDHQGPTKDLWAVCVRCDLLVSARWPLGPQDGMRLELAYFRIPPEEDEATTPKGLVAGRGERKYSLDPGEFPGRLRPRAARR